jgi:hypothetical protein
VDSLSLQMALGPSYHRIGMDVFTRYRLDCTGEVQFQHPGGVPDPAVLLAIPFPANTVEARDVELKVSPFPGEQESPISEVFYDRTGIYARCSAPIGRPLSATVRFTAFGRDRLDYPLPPARELRAVDISLALPGELPRTVPDESLQPSSTSPSQLRWELKNLVSDRHIEVLIPAAEAPLARALTLTRLVAIAVLLFGAGFWFLSEQSRPGQLDRFRWGHFMLLALTYSLFFVIFAVMELDGKFGTPVSLAASALFSLPLLVLHVSRVLDLRFAVTRVVPLGLFTLGLVLNGVYGGAYRDYGYVGALVLLIAYVTLGYQSWSAGRAAHQRVKEEEYAARRAALVERIMLKLGGQISELSGADAQAAAILGATPSLPGAAWAEVKARLTRAREPVSTLTKEFEDLSKRLTYLSTEPGWDANESCKQIERSTDQLLERVELQLARLRSELEGHQPVGDVPGRPAAEGKVYCVACGESVPDAPFCLACGASRPAALACGACGERLVIPLLTPGGEQAPKALFCPRCGNAMAGGGLPDADTTAGT